MELKQSSIDYIKDRAWECADTCAHLAADGYSPEDYPHIKYKGQYILDPWAGDEDRSLSVQDIKKEYGKDKLDLFIAQMANNEADSLKDNTFLNHPNTPDGWLYIGDDKVRYALGEPGVFNLIVVGLNPSTATPQEPDPTITRIRKIVEKTGYDGWIMINLYPKRTPEPEKLPKAVNKTLAATNIAVIDWIVKEFEIGTVYAAWGTNIENREYLIDECQKICDAIPCDYWISRGTTKYGHPKHPLYVPYDQPSKQFFVQDYLWGFETF